MNISGQLWGSDIRERRGRVTFRSKKTNMGRKSSNKTNFGRWMSRKSFKIRAFRTRYCFIKWNWKLNEIWKVVIKWNISDRINVYHLDFAVEGETHFETIIRFAKYFLHLDQGDLRPLSAGGLVTLNPPPPEAETLQPTPLRPNKCHYI